MKSSSNPGHAGRAKESSRGAGFARLTFLYWLWPDLDDEGNARKAMKRAGAACLFVAAASFFVGLLVHLGARIGAFTAWAMLDGALFAFVAWRIYRTSKVWAVAGLALYLLEICDKLAFGHLGAGWMVPLIILLYMIGGVRGAFALQQLHKPAE